MKKWFLCLTAVLVALPAYARKPWDPTEIPQMSIVEARSSNFEKFLATPGTFDSTESNVDKVPTSVSTELEVRAVKVLNLTSSKQAGAVRINTVAQIEGLFNRNTSYLDEDELDGLIAECQKMIQIYDSPKSNDGSAIERHIFVSRAGVPFLVARRGDRKSFYINITLDEELPFDKPGFERFIKALLKAQAIIKA